jgi:hypothetical protein
MDLISIGNVNKKSLLLVEACLTGNIEVLHNTYINNKIIPPFDASIFIVSCGKSTTNIVTILFDWWHDELSDDDVENALWDACSSNRLDILVLLYKWWPNITIEQINDNLFRWGCLSGFTQIVKKFMEWCPQISIDEIENGFISSAEFGFIDLVELLYSSYQIDLSAKNHKAFRMACCKGYIDIVDVIYSYGIVPNQPSDIFVSACKFNHIEIAKRLNTWYGPFNNIVYENGFKNVTKHGCCVEIISYVYSLAENISDENFGEALISLCKIGDIAFNSIQQLFIWRSQIHTIDHCFVLACKYGHIQIVEYLYNINKNVPLKMGFEMASCNNQVKIVERLLDWWCPTISDIQSITYISYSLSDFIDKYMTTKNNRIIKTNDSNISCSICYDIPNEISVTECNHYYCEKCINYWLVKNNTCPYCRCNLESVLLKNTTQPILHDSH